MLRRNKVVGGKSIGTSSWSFGFFAKFLRRSVAASQHAVLLRNRW
jgi:hypothetical protein